MRKKLLLLAVVLLAGIGIATRNGGGGDDNRFFEISKNIEIFTNMYRELNTYYVDDLNPDTLFRVGIDAMLESLDPYTTYIAEEDMDDFRYQLTGKYGGVGAIIHKYDGQFVVMEPYEGSPSQKAGLQAGDVLVAIDDKVLKSTDDESTSDALKGAPGTPVVVRFRRPGENQERSVKIYREEINVPNVPYYGMLENWTAYIVLNTFTENAARHLADALRTLESTGKVKGIILDLRGNGGGLLTEAVDVANIFVDKNQDIVSTKGKIKLWDRTFKTLDKALDPETPLVILVDGQTASASEIVAGAIQDMDRGVLVGQKSFGKGLVQNTRDVGYNAKIKLTTAKYYIPSGRCIQSVQYSHGKPVNIADSLKTSYRTRNGRTVYDGGGIEPDVKIESPVENPLARNLKDKRLYFEFATRYKTTHPAIPVPGQFQLTDAEYDEFVAFVRQHDYSFPTETEKALAQLEEKARKENTWDAVAGEFTALRKSFENDKKNDLYKNKADIKRLLEIEIVSRYYYQRGKLEYQSRNDKQLQEALRVLNDPARYNKMLSR